MLPKGRPHRVLTRYLAAFLICVLIPVVVLGLASYGNTSFVLLKELEGNTIGEMGRLSDAFDGVVSDLYQTAFRASYDPSLSWYNAERNDYTRLNLVRKLSDYKHDYVDFLLLSYPGDGTVYTNLGSMRPATVERVVFSAAISTVDDSCSRYAEMVRHTESPEIVHVTGPQHGAAENNTYLAYAYPLLNKDPIGVLYFVISEANLRRLVKDTLGDLSCAIAVLDGHDRPLFTLQDRVTLAGMPLGAATEGGAGPRVTNVSTAGEKVSFVDFRSETTGLRYVVALPLTGYVQREAEARSRVLLSVLCGLLLSGVVAIAMALRVYRPIERLASYVTTSCGAGRISRGGDELAYISTVLTEALNANEHLSRRLVSQLTFVQELALLKVVKGQVTKRTDVDAMLSTNDIRFAGGCFGVAVVSIEDERDGGKDVDSLLPLLRGALDAVPELKGHYCMGLDRRQAVLVINADHHDREHLLMGGVAHACTSALKGSAGADADVGVGRFYGDYLLLNKSLLEALAALEYRLLKGEEHVVYYADIDFAQGATQWYPVEQQGMLRQCLKQGNLPAFVDVMNDIIRVAEQRRLSLDSLRCVCFDLVNSTLKFLNEYGIPMDEDCVRALCRFASLDDLRRTLTRVAHRVCEHVNASEAAESSRMRYLRTGIIEYLYRNYGNSQLNLDLVANEFGVSAKHLSAVFKQLTGSRFVDYLRKLRVSHAKGLLASGARTVSQISRDVGFANPARFTRSFRAVEGMTPGQFRDIARA